MLFEIKVTRSYVVYEEAKLTVEAASDEEATEAAMSDLNVLPWQTTDEEPCQDMDVECEEVEEPRADYRVVGGTLVTLES